MMLFALSLTFSAQQPMPVALPSRLHRELRPPNREAVDLKYFKSYSKFSIHQEMLSDKVYISCTECLKIHCMIAKSLEGSHYKSVFLEGPHIQCITKVHFKCPQTLWGE